MRYINLLTYLLNVSYRLKVDEWQFSSRIATRTTHRKIRTLLQQLNLFTFVSLFT